MGSLEVYDLGNQGGGKVNEKGTSQFSPLSNHRYHIILHIETFMKTQG